MSITAASLSTLVNKLPTMPKELADAMSMISREDLDIDEFAACISREQGLVARLLRVANSPFYGVSGRIATVPQAVNVLGLATTRAIVVAMSVMMPLTDAKDSPLEMTGLWTHTLGVACCAQQLAPPLRVQALQAFTVGILHDLGRMILCLYAAQEYRELLLQAQTQPQFLHELEQEYFGFSHAELGAELAGRWNFPDLIADAIRCHHDPEQTQAPLAFCVYAADVFAHALLLGQSGEDRIAPVGNERWAALTLDDSKLESLLRRSLRQARAMACMI